MRNKVKTLFFGAKTDDEKEQAITFFQNHFRDKTLAKAIAQECKAIAKNPDRSVGVGFFGATHLVAGHDEDAARTTDERIPDLLLKIGKQGDECIHVNGVDVYIFPQVLAGSEQIDDFRSYFE